MKNQMLEYIKNASPPVGPFAVQRHFKMSYAQVGKVINDINSDGKVYIAVNQLGKFVIKNEEKQ